MPATPATDRHGLPGLDIRPNAAVVLYDGTCKFCVTQARRLAWWDGGKRLAFLSGDDPEAARRFPDIPPERLRREMVVVDQTGRQRGGADAVRYLTRRLPWLWWATAPLHIPATMPLWRWLYRQIARRRHWLGGNPEPSPCDSDKCEIN